MLNRNSLIGLASIVVILAPSNVCAQTQPNIVIPTIEFSGDSTSFSFKVTVDPTQQFVVGPVVISRDSLAERLRQRFTFNGGTFNPLDLNLNLTPVASVNPIGQSTIDATVGNRAISSKTLLGLASGSNTVDGTRSTGNNNTSNLGLIVNGDDPILTMP